MNKTYGLIIMNNLEWFNSVYTFSDFDDYRYVKSIKKVENTKANSVCRDIEIFERIVLMKMKMATVWITFS